MQIEIIPVVNKKNPKKFIPFPRKIYKNHNCRVLEKKSMMNNILKNLKTRLYKTYRIYDYNRNGTDGKPRELHTDMALDAIDFNFYYDYKTKYNIVKNRTSKVIQCDYFYTNILEFDESITKDYNLIDTFVIYICLDGKIAIIDDNNLKTDLSKGETVLIPAVLKNIILTPFENTKILEVFIK